MAGDEAKGKKKEEVAGCLIIEAVIGLQLQVHAHLEIRWEHHHCFSVPGDYEGLDI